MRNRDAQYAFFTTGNLRRAERRDSIMAPVQRVPDPAVHLLDICIEEAGLTEAELALIAAVRGGDTPYRYALSNCINPRTALRAYHKALDKIKTAKSLLITEARAAYYESQHPSRAEDIHHCPGGQEFCRKHGYCHRRGTL